MSNYYNPKLKLQTQTEQLLTAVAAKLSGYYR